jgi:hypothetical protein
MRQSEGEKTAGWRVRRRLPPLHCCLLAAVAAGRIAAAQEILPFSEVKTGMTGVGRTVFRGTAIEEFGVEVIGTLSNVAPQRNLILVRLSGGPLATTGVMSGMSGSPVYIGDRLVGAVAYTWGFAKEPLAGVTPIQEMLSIERKESPADDSRAGLFPPPGGGAAGLSLLRDPARLPAHFAGYFPSASRASAASPMHPIGAPLVFSGFPGGAIDLLRAPLAAAGLVPVQGGSRGRGTGAGADGVVPGAGVGIGLVRGDVEIAAICTVTHREDDRVLACGHPLLNLGPTEYVMTTASVEGVFPSLNESFKFAIAGEDVGVFRQDRTAGVFGYLRRKPRMIPVRVELQPERGPSRRFAFDVVDDPFLAPFLLYASLNGVLSSEERDYGEVSLSYRAGSTIRVAGEEEIALRNLFSGDMARLYASGTVAYLVQLLLNSEYRPVQIEGINLILGHEERRRTARLERAWLSRDRARAGETVRLSATIRPFRGPEVTRHVDIAIPREVPPGPLYLQVGDGVALARAEREEEDDFVPRDLGQLIWLINHLRRSNTIYAVLTRGDNGILFQGERLPNLPPSIARVMVRPQTRSNYLRLWYRGVAEESIETDYALEGYRLLPIEVEE